ncbi:MAG: hypothetical protein CM15mP51_11880 [Porticoccaceae bacterium]|nr:MAG: hypothetical protein CM15mP51_11880 [Porticoccaceae bacterium]
MSLERIIKSILIILLRDGSFRISFVATNKMNLLAGSTGFLGVRS